MPYIYPLPLDDIYHAMPKRAISLEICHPIIISPLFIALVTFVGLLAKKITLNPHYS